MRDYIDNPHLKLRGETSTVANVRRPLLLALCLSVVAGILLAFDLLGYLGPVRALIGPLIAPVVQPFTGIRNSGADLWNTIADWQNLRAENESLRQQNSQLQAELIEREQAMVEVVHLREQLAIENEQPWHLLGAEVLIRSPDAVRRMMTINQGRVDNVRPGMAVIGQTDSGPVALVGVVERVDSHTSSVLLTTDVSSRVSARVLYNSESSLGLVQGQWQRGSRLRLEYVEHEDVLVIGARVVTAGLTGELGVPLPLAAMPVGVPIGEIEQLSSDGHSQFAELRPYADPDQVRYVWVILNQEN